MFAKEHSNVLKEWTSQSRVVGRLNGYELLVAYLMDGIIKDVCG